jgi:phosphoglycerate-specific signal transduction histidine kinase
MSEKNAEDLQASAAGIIKDNSEVSAGGTRTLKAVDYQQHMAAAGISAATLKAVQAADDAMTVAALHQTSEDLAEQIAVAKKNGDDPSLCKSKTVIAQGRGAKIVAHVTATRTTRNPRTGEQSEVFGAVKLSRHVPTGIKRTVADGIASDIEKALGA